MLKLCEITKEYRMGDQTVTALNGVSIQFRRNEFVSVLGPSGCGKTTLLNIIGGLDQYTSGDLIINGVSTKQYREKDWDTYRNHSVGFVFQSYNLIPHQTVLANVELALTLSGVSRAERRERAINALKQVGLEDQMQKKPNQMSGGQMQRVAIARALVNDPDILLADEPTGALDTQTSIQIMEILKEVAKTKLVVMVTHNPDLAETYSTRIIKLLDGQIVGDSAPIKAEEPTSPSPVPQKKKGKRSMSFWTALSLSFNNLLTKKGRTFMTAFAGSIGIIGIALILSVSSGVNRYINTIQRDTLASYPIQLEEESTDLSSLVTTIMGTRNEQNKEPHEDGFVYESSVMVDLMNAVTNVQTNHNDLKAFKAYMENNPELFDPYVSATQYSYDFDWKILTADTDGNVIKADAQKLLTNIMGGQGSAGMGSSSSLMSSGYRIWQELLAGEDGEMIHPLIKEEYDLLYGEWPQNYDEILLVVNENNTLSDLSLYALGLRTEEEILKTIEQYYNKEVIDTSDMRKYSYEEMCALQFRLFLASECYYQKMTGDSYYDVTETAEGCKMLYSSGVRGVPLHIVGIIRPNPDATSTVLSGTVAYTAALTEYALNKTAESELINKQKAAPETDVILGIPFRTGTEMTDEEKIAAAKTYEAALSEPERIELRKQIYAIPTEEQITNAIGDMIDSFAKDPDSFGTNLKRLLEQSGIPAQMYDQYMGDFDIGTPENLAKLKEWLATSGALKNTVREQLIQISLNAMKGKEADLLLLPLTDEQYLTIYNDFMPPAYSSSTYEQNLKLLGNVSKDTPKSIALYASTFENKDQISKAIQNYNKTVEEDKEISYTDYVALLMSSITTIVNSITYVLIAFVAISLIVSSIMIGIITYISVLERTKEIGILRSIGASRRDVGHVFNAETIIIGFVAGTIGIAISLLLDQIINLILYHLTGITTLKTLLPVGAAFLLILISVLLTLIAGLFPAGIASRKKPVEALRTE